MEWCAIAYNNNYGDRLKKVSEANKISLKGNKNHLGHKHTEEAKNKVSIKNKGKLANGKNPKAKKVVCLTTNETFDCIKLAAEAYKITPQCITKCCKGKWKSAGKLEDGTKLKWEYLEEEI